MLWLFATLVVVGFLLTIAGAVDSYRGRMRESKDSPGFYDPPSSGARGLILAIVGAVVALASGLLGITLG